VLSETDIDRFIAEGAVRLPRAFGRALADECRLRLWEATGSEENDPATWTRPVVRIDGRGDAPFRDAANTRRLHIAYDQLAGRGRWVPRDGLGTFPIRFPVPEPPGDDGWHIESTGVGVDGQPIVDPASRERVLLMLFLFSDVGHDDAPTRIRLGSHLEAARLLVAAGGPVDFFEVAKELQARTAQLPEALATGDRGDVWLCHPFLVHAAQRHRGTRVKFMAQPPLAGTGPVDHMRAASDRSPVEEAIHRAVG
jgi:hypothetical protein